MASSAIRTTAAGAAAEVKAPVSAAGLIPGIALLAVVGYAGKFIEHFIATYGKAPGTTWYCRISNMFCGQF